MGGKKAAGENSKKAAGNAKKADAAAAKQAVEDAKKASAEDAKWAKGSKDGSKAEAAAAKQAEAARKKAEKEALLAEEEASLPSKPGKKPAPKKSRGLDLSGLDAPSSKNTLAAFNATGIDNALDALSLTNNTSDKIDRHPERRFKAAYTAFEERRLDEMKDEKGLRRQQKIDQIRKEFEKHPDNPFNQVAGSYNMSKEEMAALRDEVKGAKEAMLTGK
ncbi:coiled-coil domain-containing protein 124 like protein [Acrodontium crateriforme]|uniref:Coiled-coil domain-containing protein 124 like protein n=1 Tax=Acrodontium crateriforme TaxID=150365 RepID=A0AAQ3M2C8_9PEZI|nr:coiled-coil domain-containing protein 124 like protein [Acrodontium crateriforme]